MGLISGSGGIHNYKTHALRDCSATREATAVKSPCAATILDPALYNWRKPALNNEDPEQPKIKE